MIEDQEGKMKRESSDRKKKVFILSLLALSIIPLFFFVMAQLPTPNYTLSGDSVWIDDQNVLINITPHTSNEPVITFRSKNFTGNIDLVVGFNTTQVTPIKATTNIRVENVTRGYICNYNFNYTLSPNYFWCYNTIVAGNTTNVTIFEHSFETGSIPLKTANWTEQAVLEDDISGIFNSVNVDFQGFDRWYYKLGIPITANQTYQLKLYLQQQGWRGNYKYFFGVKPSSQTLEQAIASGTFYYIDPWTASLDDGLVAYYDMEIGTGTNITDQLNRYNMTSNSSTWTTGKVGTYAHNFSAVSSQFARTIANVTQLTGQNYTINGWIKLNFNKGSSYANVWKVGINTQPGNLVGCQDLDSEIESNVWKLNTEGVVFSDGSSSDDVGTFVMMTMSYDTNSNNLTLYRNNVLVTAGTLTNDHQAGELWLAKRCDGYSGAYGVFQADELGLWNRTLTASERSDLYNSGTGITRTTNTAPTVTIRYPYDQQNTSLSTIVFTAVPVDGEDATGLNVSIYGNWSGGWHLNVSNTSALNNTQTNFSISAIADGKYIYGARVGDKDGSNVTNTTNYTFTKDTVAPSITLPFYVNATVKTSTSSTLTLNISVTDTTTNPSACKVDINGTNQTYSVSSGWCNTTDGYLTNLADGNRTINVYANDSTGQFGINSNFVVFVDATAPVISLPFYTNATQKKTTDLLTLNISVTDATSGLTGSACRVNINGTNQSVALSSGWCNTTGIVLTGNTDGNKTINVYVNDTQNTWGVNASFVVTIDTTAPVITLPFYTNLTAKKSSATLTLNVSVTDATTSPSACRIESNGTNTTYSVSSGWCNVTNVPLTGLADGNQVINVYANDSLNIFGINNSFYVLVDSTPPSVSFSIENNSIFTVEQFVSTLQVSPFYNITETNPSTANMTIKWPNATNLASNTSTKFNHLETFTLTQFDFVQYEWKVESNDTAGNVNTAVLYFRSDRQQPTSIGGGGLPTASLLDFDTNITQEDKPAETISELPSALLEWFNSNLFIVILVLAFMIIGLAGRGKKRK